MIRHYVSSTRSKSHHRFPGYSREEIILGSQAHSTVIVSHSTPSPREVCTVCGHIVEDGGWFRCGCGKPDNGLEPTTNCTGCNSWHHVHCSCVGGLLTPIRPGKKALLPVHAPLKQRRDGVMARAPHPPLSTTSRSRTRTRTPRARREASNEDLEDFLPSSLTGPCSRPRSAPAAGRASTRPSRLRRPAGTGSVWCPVAQRVSSGVTTPKSTPHPTPPR
ncbi:hypothetical protein C8J57DRAFT_316517 [Mycena rebaudengoi]|nr:hypothetical protein C8J57DRAFT_316517 [Mycena rebaudengoi]